MNFTRAKIGDKVKLDQDGKYAISQDDDALTVIADVEVTDSKNKVDDYRFREGKTVVIDAKATSVSTKWNSIIDTDKKLIGNAIVICKNGKTDIEYMFFFTTEDSSSDVIDAVAKEIYDDEAILVNDEGENTLEYTTNFAENAMDKLGAKEGFVVYQTNAKDKIRDAAMLVDVKAFDKLDLDASVTKDIVNDAEVLGTRLAIADLTNVIKEHFEVDTLDLDLLELSFRDGVSEDLDQLDIVDLDKDTVVYDLREGFTVCKLDELSLSTLAYIIPFKNGECDKNEDANILVVLD